MFYVYLYFPIIFLCRLVYMIEITGTKYKKRFEFSLEQDPQH